MAETQRNMIERERGEKEMDRVGENERERHRVRESEREKIERKRKFLH